MSLITFDHAHELLMFKASHALHTRAPGQPESGFYASKQLITHLTVGPQLPLILTMSARHRGIHGRPVFNVQIFFPGELQRLVMRFRRQAYDEIKLFFTQIIEGLRTVVGNTDANFIHHPFNQRIGYARVHTRRADSHAGPAQVSEYPGRHHRAHRIHRAHEQHTTWQDRMLVRARHTCCLHHKLIPSSATHRPA